VSSKKVRDSFRPASKKERRSALIDLGWQGMTVAKRTPFSEKKTHFAFLI